MEHGTLDCVCAQEKSLIAHVQKDIETQGSTIMLGPVRNVRKIKAHRATLSTFPIQFSFLSYGFSLGKLFIQRTQKILIERWGNNIC